MGYLLEKVGLSLYTVPLCPKGQIYRWIIKSKPTIAQPSTIINFGGLNKYPYYLDRHPVDAGLEISKGKGYTHL